MIVGINVLLATIDQRHDCARHLLRRHDSDGRSVDLALGYRTLENVLEYRGKFTVPNTESMTWPGGSQQLTHGVFEITGYMPRDFSSFYAYNVSDNTLTPTKGRTGLTTAEREELARLRKENRQLRLSGRS